MGGTPQIIIKIRSREYTYDFGVPPFQKSSIPIDSWPILERVTVHCGLTHVDSSRGTGELRKAVGNLR